MNKDKRFAELILEEAQKLIDWCKAKSCGRWILGYRYVDYNGGDSTKPESYKRPCPTCAPYQDMVKEFFWHNPVGNYMCSCGNKGNPFSKPDKAKCWRPNPTFKVQTIVAALERLGKLNLFEQWLFSYCYDEDIKGVNICNLFRIVWSDSLMLQAAISYLEVK